MESGFPKGSQRGRRKEVGILLGVRLLHEKKLKEEASGGKERLSGGGGGLQLEV